MVTENGPFIKLVFEDTNFKVFVGYVYYHCKDALVHDDVTFDSNDVHILYGVLLLLY